MGYFGKIIKNTLLFGAVGALLAVAFTPVLLPAAEFLGLSVAAKGLLVLGTAGNVAWGATFFGAFGALHSALEPIFNIFSGGKSHGQPGHHVSKTVSYSQEPQLSVEPQLSAQPSLAVDNTNSKFQDILASKNAVSYQAQLSADRANAPEHTLQ